MSWSISTASDCMRTLSWLCKTAAACFHPPNPPAKSSRWNHGNLSSQVAFGRTMEQAGTTWKSSTWTCGSSAHGCKHWNPHGCSCRTLARLDRGPGHDRPLLQDKGGTTTRASDMTRTLGSRRLDTGSDALHSLSTRAWVTDGLGRGRLIGQDLGRTDWPTGTDALHSLPWQAGGPEKRADMPSTSPDMEPMTVESTEWPRLLWWFSNTEEGMRDDKGQIEDPSNCTLNKDISEIMPHCWTGRNPTSIVSSTNGRRAPEFGFAQWWSAQFSCKQHWRSWLGGQQGNPETPRNHRWWRYLRSWPDPQRDPSISSIHPQYRSIRMNSPNCPANHLGPWQHSIGTKVTTTPREGLSDSGYPSFDHSPHATHLPTCCHHISWTINWIRWIV